MPITTVDDDRNAPDIGESVTIYDDDLGVFMAIKTITEGGTGRDKSSDGPGFVTQQSVGANLTTLAAAIGELPIGGASGVPTVLAANDTATRKYLMQVAVIAGTPVFAWVQIAATDIATGIVPVARILGSGLPGVVYQPTFGSALATTSQLELATLVLKRFGGIDLPPTLAIRGSGDDEVGVYMGNSNDVHSWGVLTTVETSGGLGAWYLHNPDTGTNAISVDTSNNVTLDGLTAARGFTASPRNCHTGGRPATSSSDGTDSTPVVTEFYFAEIFVPANVTVIGVAPFNGSVASGNIRVGLFFSDGVLAAQSAITVMSGTDTYQRIPFTAPLAVKGPGTYYVGLSVDNTTARFNTHTLGNAGTGKKTGQVFSDGFTAITPPTTFTTALGPIASLY